MKIAITGSNGFIGGELVNYFLSKGDEVLLLQRKAPGTLAAGASYAQYDLSEPAKLPDLSGFNALIHTAYMPFKPETVPVKEILNPTLSLYKQCKKQGVLFVFLSSMSAHANASSEYGKHKYGLEQKLGKENCFDIEARTGSGQTRLSQPDTNNSKKNRFCHSRRWGQSARSGSLPGRSA